MSIDLSIRTTQVRITNVSDDVVKVKHYVPLEYDDHQHAYYSRKHQREFDNEFVDSNDLGYFCFYIQLCECRLRTQCI